MTLSQFNVDYAPTVQAVAAVLGLVSLMLLWWQIKKTNDWNRVSAAFQIMEMDKFYLLEEQATKACKAIEVPFPAVLTMDAARKIRSSYDAYHSVKNLAIFLERICVAYQAGYVDKHVIVFTYGALLSGYHSVLESYIAVTREENNAPEVYRDFKRTADDARISIDKCRRKISQADAKADAHGGITPRF
jgi:hypothetical protein